MKQRIETREPVVAIAFRLTGSYSTLPYGEAWKNLGKCCQANNVKECSDGAEYINVYYDDPEQTPPGRQRADVCIAAEAGRNDVRGIINGMRLTDGVQRITIPGGRYAVFTHEGPYEKLGETYRYIYAEYLPKGEVEDDCEARGCMFEKYLNDPETTAPDELLTEIWIPVKD